MYGYVTPVKENMSLADFALYRAFYCGICKATGKMHGQLPRFATNYDIVFLSALLHDYLVQEVTFETKGCVGNPFKKKTSVCRNELLDKIVDVNILLCYYKAVDGVRDKEGMGKKIAKSVFTRHYKRAAKSLPEIDKLISDGYEKLFKLEQNNTAGLDRVSDCFASILSGIADKLLGERTNENVVKLCYNIGKFVYLTDALDDVEEDNKAKRYNPFLAVYPDFTSRQQYFEKYKPEIEFILAITVNRAIECFNQLTFTQSYDLLRNIVHLGLRAKTDQLLKSNSKLPRPRI